MPEVIAEILSDSFRRKRVLTQCDASDVLREAFARTEERIMHYYEVYSQHSLCCFYELDVVLPLPYCRTPKHDLY